MIGKSKAQSRKEGNLATLMKCTRQENVLYNIPSGSSSELNKLDWQRQVLSHTGIVVMEGCQGHRQGDLLALGVGLVGQCAPSERQRDWGFCISDCPHFPFAFIPTVEMKISCCNYCSVRRPNSAKSIASHPSGAIEGIRHQLFMSSTCSSGLQWKVMAPLCDT